MANIVLIGMPGCGKSTVGALLASALHMDFVDTDIVLQGEKASNHNRCRRQRRFLKDRRRLHLRS